MDKLVILFTMEGCPYCVQMKDQLKESNINFVERDIDEHKDEYDMFVEIIFTSIIFILIASL